MDRKRNYQNELEKIIKKADHDNPPSLLLHACCAPCSSYCLEYLSKHFKVTVFYYNPNITPWEEYRKRVAEEKKLIAAYNSEIIWGRERRPSHRDPGSGLRTKQIL